MASANPSENVKQLTQELINKDWSPLKTTTPKDKQGIYAIGVDGESKYLGRTKDFSRRFGEYATNITLRDPKPSTTDIDDITESMRDLNVTDKGTTEESNLNIKQYLQQMAREGRADNVQVKFVETPDHKKLEGKVQQEYEKQVGYPLPLNKKRGDGLGK